MRKLQIEDLGEKITLEKPKKKNSKANDLVNNSINNNHNTSFNLLNICHFQDTGEISLFLKTSVVFFIIIIIVYCCCCYCFCCFDQEPVSQRCCVAFLSLHREETKGCCMPKSAS